MKILRKLTPFLALFAFVAAGIWFYFTPQLAFREIRAAVRDRNLGLLESRVNFPALRAGLKESAQSRLAETLGAAAGGNPFGRMGAALAGTVVDPLIEQLVTPETLALLLRGDRWRSAGAQNSRPVAAAPSGAGEPAISESADKETETTRAYETFNRYVIAVKKRGAAGEPVTFVLTREYLVDWKLSEIRNPF